MKRYFYLTPMLFIILSFMIYGKATACSTFKLQKANSLIYGHYLNSPGIKVPGMVFINKRGIFKTGRTWSEIITKEQKNPSSLCWISKYGSVTFNIFGRDLPDGGINEEGLFIWEMSEKADYPKNENLPKLNQMSWMQYILDNYSTMEEAVLCASEIEIDGWEWHFFVGDAKGNTAVIEFIGQKAVIYKGENMPIPGLFNTLYSRDLELMKYYKGFGGQYDPDLNDSNVPRIVKTAKMIRDYKLTQNAVDYSFKMLEYLNNTADWSIVFDAGKRNIFFRTNLNREIKSFSIDDIDFSNTKPVSVLDMNIKNGGNVLNQFHPYTNVEIKNFIESSVLPIIPEEAFTNGGLTLKEFSERISTLCNTAALNEKQYFKGVWMNKPDTTNDEMEVTIKLETKKDVVFGQINIPKLSKEALEINNISLIHNSLIFTGIRQNTFIEAKAVFDEETMILNLFGLEECYGKYILYKE